MAEEGAGPSPDAAPVPTPLEVPLEEQIKDLPPLPYPVGDPLEARAGVEGRRRRRVQLEVAGGGLMLLAGLGVFVATRSVILLVIAIVGAAALGAYELLVDSFE